MPYLIEVWNNRLRWRWARLDFTIWNSLAISALVSLKMTILKEELPSDTQS